MYQHRLLIVSYDNTEALLGNGENSCLLDFESQRTCGEYKGIFPWCSFVIVSIIYCTVFSKVYLSFFPKNLVSCVINKLYYVFIKT